MQKHEHTNTALPIAVLEFCIKCCYFRAVRVALSNVGAWPFLVCFDHTSSEAINSHRLLNQIRFVYGTASQRDSLIELLIHSLLLMFKSRAWILSLNIAYLCTKSLFNAYDF